MGNSNVVMKEDLLKSIECEQISVAEESDLDFLWRLEVLCFEDYRRSTKAMIKRSITSEYQFVLMIDDEQQQRVGSVTVRRYKKMLRIMSLAILPEAQGKMYGKWLVDAVIQIGKDMFSDGITLEADSNSDRLISWYESFGFEQVKVLEDYYAKDKHAIRMQMSLTEVFQYLVVTDFDTNFFDDFPNIKHIRAGEYIDNVTYQLAKDIRVLNFCSNYKYQTVGYYVSLLALARNQVVYPSAGLLRDIDNRKVVRSIGEEAHQLMQAVLESCDSGTLTINSYFGKADHPKYQKLISRLNTLYHAPLMRYQFKKSDCWYLNHLDVISFQELEDKQLEALHDEAKAYFANQKFIRSSIKYHEYDLAILIDRDEKLPPSDQAALHAFEEAAGLLGFYVEYITKKDFARIPEFDALFIRTTTSVNDYTYEFSRYAYAEGLVVIDDPWSILRCANKIYLHEALSHNKVRTPKTWVLNKKGHTVSALSALEYPLILKLPDSAFSAGVYKVTDKEDCRLKLKEMFKQSELILAQEYMPTDYDWRIGVLDGEVIYACKYYMAKGHWQIVNWENDKKAFEEGAYEAIALNKVPKEVLKTALKAARVIGDGLYGVDVKMSDSKAYVIEVNDNPNIDSGVEDGIEGSALYMKVMLSFYNRLKNDLTLLRNIN
ncbi:MAG: GNAT family N-acetyltransferase [Clostridia bacterium]|nr:GNAT family N-acetyltransferase [Clostridia bacterium]